MNIILIARLVACLLLAGITRQTIAQSKKVKKTPKDSSQRSFAIVPVVGVSPETGFTVATLGVLNFKTGKDYQKSRLSNVMPFASLSFTGQIAFGTFYRVFSGNDRYLFQGRLIYNIGNAVYYGIGNDLPESNKENSTNQTISMATRVFRRLDKNLFFGLQYQYVHFTSLERESGGLLETSQVAGYDGSVVSGLGAAILYDNRENILNPQKGLYAEMSGYRFNKGAIGEYEFTSLQLDIRKYFQPFSDLPHTLAIQGFASFVIGDPPYSQLSALGGPTIMRGYVRGRYREKHHLAMQAEYRFPVWRKFGMAVFGGLGDVHNKVMNFNSTDLKGSYGVGLRFSILPKDRVNLRLDYGRGSDGSSGIYLGIGEAF
ncbi:hypothetical protein BKI52_44410 [marine bacterium AO1-C]|nr:hypothetical protein BKI52_44410 [marine bacterium AO1-C]